MKKENKDLNLKDLNPKNWRPIPGFQPRYLINREGVVISVLDRPGYPSHGKITKIKTFIRDNESLYVSLYKIDSRVSFTSNVAKLVMSAFGEYKLLEIIHKDGNNSNCSLKNLKYITPPNFNSKKEIWRKMNDDFYPTFISSLGRVYRDSFICTRGNTHVGFYSAYRLEEGKFLSVQLAYKNGTILHKSLNQLMAEYFKPDEYDWDKVSAYYAKLLK